MNFLIVGAGDVGVSLASKLVEYNHDVTLVECDHDRVEKLTSDIDIQIICGNGVSPQVLSEAQILTADYFIAVTEVDEINIAACMVAKLLSPTTKRVARVRNLNLKNSAIPADDLSNYFDLIINPEQAAADYLLQLFRVPGAKELVEFADGRVWVLGLTINAKSALVDKKLNNLPEINKDSHFVIMAILRGSKLIVPRGEDTIKNGDVIYLFTKPKLVKEALRLAGKEAHAGETAMVWGNGTLGKAVAKALINNGSKVKLIVTDEAEASDLAAEFQDILVLHGDATDSALLEEENIASIDAFISATADEENNILAALLAKRLGATSVMAILNKASYLSLTPSLGIDVVVSSRLAAARAIFQHVHTGSSVSTFTLRHNEAGFVEFVVQAASDVAQRTIANLDLPNGSIVGAIVRNDAVIIPSGQDVLLPGDKVVLFVLKNALKKIEKVLGMHIELIS